jgi:DNA-binding MarR family transcriptional regulator
MKTNHIPKIGNIPNEMMSPILEEHLQFISNGKDTDGIEILAMTKMISHVIGICFSRVDPESEITPARWGLMMRLLEEEEDGNCEGITPTSMSHSSNVKKNTISSILRGMENQELIERNIDQSDRRIFRIRLTAKGRQLVKDTNPQRVDLLNDLVSGLESKEREQLIRLLKKLIDSVLTKSNFSSFPPPID